MHVGTIISGGAHTALILFALFGGMFARDELPPPDVAQVSVVSEEEFAALTRPDVGEEPEAAPPTAALEVPDTVRPEPEPQPEPKPDPQPRTDPETAPPEPDPQPDLPPAPPEPEGRDDRAVGPEDVPRPRPRVSTEAAPPPPPEAEQAPEVVEAPDPDPVEEPEQVVEEETPAAPPETAEEIVTEAERPTQLSNAAPIGTPRPRSRPARPEPPVAEAPRIEGRRQSAASDNVNEAAEETIAGLEQLLDQAPQEGIPAGPPLTAGEKEAFRLAVRQCWNVDTGSQAANVTVSIRFQMTLDARVVSSSIRQTGASGGSSAAINAAFEAGRRAILRCQNQSGGYRLPEEKYGQWQTVEITFNPEGMRLR